MIDCIAEDEFSLYNSLSIALVQSAFTVVNTISIASLLSALTVACYYRNNASKIPREGEADLKARATRAALRRQQAATREGEADLEARATRAALKRAATRKEVAKIRAAKAAFQLQEAAGAHTPILRSSQNYSRDTLEIVKLSKQIKKKGLDSAHHSPPVGGVEASIGNEALVCNEGGTGFWVIPTLPNSDHARQILRRLSTEFLPLIQQRGYRVRSVSEYYRIDGKSASDGLHFELGGEKRTVQPNDKLQEFDMERTLGYNRRPRCIPCSGDYGPFRFLTPECTIHLRLRKWHDANSFMTYEDLVATMAHELAHCVHPNHRAEFWQLTKEILDDYNTHTGGCVELRKGEVEDGELDGKRV